MHACPQECTEFYIPPHLATFVLYTVPELSGTPGSPTVTQTAAESKHIATLLCALKVPVQSCR